MIAAADMISPTKRLACGESFGAKKLIRGATHIAPETRHNHVVGMICASVCQRPHMLQSRTIYSLIRCPYATVATAPVLSFR